MRFYGLDLNLLVVLDALLVEQNITRAGERLFLSQPATSAALARLREYFQDELLVQNGRKMVRTPKGEALSQPIRDLLIQMRSTLDNRHQFDPAQAQRKFVLMASDYISTVLLPQVSRRLNELAPHASLEMIPPNDNPREMIERGHVDLLVLPTPTWPRSTPARSCSRTASSAWSARIIQRWAKDFHSSNTSNWAMYWHAGVNSASRPWMNGFSIATTSSVVSKSSPTPSARCQPSCRAPDA